METRNKLEASLLASILILLLLGGAVTLLSTKPSDVFKKVEQLELRVIDLENQLRAPPAKEFQAGNE